MSSASTTKQREGVDAEPARRSQIHAAPITTDTHTKQRSDPDGWKQSGLRPTPPQRGGPSSAPPYLQSNPLMRPGLAGPGPARPPRSKRPRPEDSEDRPDSG